MLAFDTSVDGRYALYNVSMQAMLNPDERVSKLFVLDRDIVIDIAPEVELLGRDIGLGLRIPAGFPAVSVNSLRFKDLVEDPVIVSRHPDRFEPKYATVLDADERADLAQGLRDIRDELIRTKSLSAIDLVLGREEAVVGRVEDLTLQVGNDFIQRFYSNVLSPLENAGHRFGEGLRRAVPGQRQRRASLQNRPARRRQAGADRVPQDVLTEGAMADTERRKTRLATKITRIAAVLQLLVAAGGAYAWAKFFGEVPQEVCGDVEPERRAELCASDVEERFKYGSLGAEWELGVPYPIFHVLPRVFGELMPGPGGYAAFGIP